MIAFDLPGSRTFPVVLSQPQNFPHSQWSTIITIEQSYTGFNAGDAHTERDTTWTPHFTKRVFSSLSNVRTRWFAFSGIAGAMVRKITGHAQAISYRSGGPRVKVMDPGPYDRPQLVPFLSWIEDSSGMPGGSVLQVRVS